MKTIGRSSSRSEFVGRVAVVFGVVFGLASCSSSSHAAAPAQTAKQLLTAATLAERSGNFTASKKALDDILQLAPAQVSTRDYTIAYYDLGVIAQTQGMVSEAVNNYKRAIQFDPNNVGSMYNIAVALAPTNPVASMGWYHQVLVISPNDPNALFNLGLLEYSRGQLSQGRAHLHAAIRLSPQLASRVPPTVVLNP